jgi:SAM-dependent methyltransferase
MKINNIDYWDEIADEYQHCTSISCDDFHYGPLVPGDGCLKLLPRDLKGKKCLELGCGAAQNSVYLAKKGAVCTAIDSSAKQLDHATKLAQREGVQLELIQKSIDKLNELDIGSFDLIHSSYAISFVEDPQNMIQQSAALLNKGGQFILSTGHPLASGEWLEVEDESGVFISNYFNPVPDIRYDDDEQPLVSSKFYPVSQIFDWISNAGLHVAAIKEPQPMDIDSNPGPYLSEAWREEYNKHITIPLIVIFSCFK